MKKTRPKVGDTCWFVEWCSKLAFYDEFEQDIDRDSCKEEVRRVSTKEEAIELAKDVYPITTNTFGVVSYWPAEFVPYDEDDAARFPYAGFWEDTADAEYYEGED